MDGLIMISCDAFSLIYIFCIHLIRIDCFLHIVAVFLIGVAMALIVRFLTPSTPSSSGRIILGQGIPFLPSHMNL